MAIVTGSLGALNASQAIITDGSSGTPQQPSGVGSVSCQLSGTFVGTLTFEASSDGVNWNAVAAYPTAGGQATQTAAAAGQFIIPVFGYQAVRARMSAFTSGAATATLDVAAGALNIPMTATGAGAVDSAQAGGAVAAPGAGAAVVAAITPGAGTWEIAVTTGLGGAASLAADAGNMQLQKNAAALTRLAVSGSGGCLNPTVRATLLVADTLSINAIGAATAGVVYSAVLVAKRVA